MASTGQAEKPHAFTERDHARVSAVVRTVEGMGQGGSTHRRRWPQDGGGEGGKVVRRGRLSASMTGKQLEPAVLVQGHIEGLKDPNDVSQGGTLTLGGDFYTVNYHDTPLEAGVQVTCAPWEGDLWGIIQADCVPVDNTLPPPPCPPGEEPTCPPQQEPCCVDGVWTCCDLPPPPPDGDCGPMPGEFFCLDPNFTPCCVNGVWDCCGPAPVPPI